MQIHANKYEQIKNMNFLKSANYFDAKTNHIEKLYLIIDLIILDNRPNTTAL